LTVVGNAARSTANYQANRMTPFPDFPELEDDETAIDFNSEDTDFEIENPDKISYWIKRIIVREQCELNYLNYIFCSDDYLHKINVEHLDHDTLTDIITFPYAEHPYIESDIFISIDRVRENAEKFEVSFEKEFLRVVIHGVLHLCGFGDKTPAEAALMRKKEDESIALFI